MTDAIGQEITLGCVVGFTTRAEGSHIRCGKVTKITEKKNKYNPNYMEPKITIQQVYERYNIVTLADRVSTISYSNNIIVLQREQVKQTWLDELDTVKV